MDDIKCPKGEMVWVRYCLQDGTTKFLLTSKKQNRDFYFLYEVVDGKLVKLGRSRTPPELEQKIDIHNKLKPAK